MKNLKKLSVLFGNPTPFVAREASLLRRDKLRASEWLQTPPKNDIENYSMSINIVAIVRNPAQVLTFIKTLLYCEK